MDKFYLGKKMVFRNRSSNRKNQKQVAEQKISHLLLFLRRNMKKNLSFYETFIHELESMLNCEKKITETHPNWIKMASSNHLKETLAMHLEETENQVKRIENIFFS